MGQDSTVKELQLLKELHANDAIAFEQKHVARVKKLEVENQKLQCSNETMTQELTAFMEEIKTLQVLQNIVLLSRNILYILNYFRHYLFACLAEQVFGGETTERTEWPNVATV